MTIKKDLRCPNCDGRRFIQLERAVERGGVGSPKPLPVILLQEKGPSGQRLSYAGAFELLICSKCGLTEWYAHDLPEIKDNPEGGVRIIDATVPPSGAYR